MELQIQTLRNTAEYNAEIFSKNFHLLMVLSQLLDGICCSNFRLFSPLKTLVLVWRLLTNSSFWRSFCLRTTTLLLEDTIFKTHFFSLSANSCGTLSSSKKSSLFPLPPSIDLPMVIGQLLLRTEINIGFEIATQSCSIFSYMLHCPMKCPMRLSNHFFVNKENIQQKN